MSEHVDPWPTKLWVTTTVQWTTFMHKNAFLKFLLFLFGFQGKFFLISNLDFILVDFYFGFLVDHNKSLDRPS